MAGSSRSALPSNGRARNPFAGRLPSLHPGQSLSRPREPPIQALLVLYTLPLLSRILRLDARGGGESNLRLYRPLYTLPLLSKRVTTSPGPDARPVPRGTLSTHLAPQSPKWKRQAWGTGQLAALPPPLAPLYGLPTWRGTSVRGNVPRRPDKLRRLTRPRPSLGEALMQIKAIAKSLWKS